jgi:hypothetical protein
MPEIMNADAGQTRGREHLDPDAPEIRSVKLAAVIGAEDETLGVLPC